MYIQVFTHPLCTDTQIASKYLLLQIRENSSSLLSQYMHISMRFSKMYIWNKIWKILPNASSKKMLLFPHISPHICHIYALFLLVLKDEKQHLLICISLLVSLTIFSWVFGHLQFFPCKSVVCTFACLLFVACISY